MITQYETTCWRPPCALPATHEWWIAPAIAWHAKPNASVAATTIPSRCERRNANSEPADERDVEDDARLVRVAQQLEQRPDHERAEHDAAHAPGAAEDDHRVDGDQQHEIEGQRQDARAERRRRASP